MSHPPSQSETPHRNWGVNDGWNSLFDMTCDTDNSGCACIWLGADGQTVNINSVREQIVRVLLKQGRKTLGAARLASVRK